MCGGSLRVGSATSWGRFKAMELVVAQVCRRVGLGLRHPRPHGMFVLGGPCWGPRAGLGPTGCPSPSCFPSAGL